MLKGMFTKPENLRMYWKEFVHQAVEIGVGSLPIVVIISVFLGAVTTVQTTYQLVSPLVPLSTIAQIVRDGLLLELSPTVVCIVLAGVAGSKIASELGNMRVSEQIDALEVMGVNALNYLVFPKITALLLYPFVIGLSMFLGVFGGWVAAVYGGFSSSVEFIQGLQDSFIPFHITYAFIKTIIFAMILATIPAYHGFYMKGGALEVGKASTTAFVWTSVVIIIVNYVITQMLLS